MFGRNMTMDANKAAYWIAVAALVVGLGTQYREGGFAPLHRVADEASARAGSIFSRVALDAELKMDEVRALAIRSSAGFSSGFQSKFETIMASAQASEMAREQRKMLRNEEREKAEMKREQIRAEREIARAQAEIQRSVRRAALAQVREQYVVERTDAGNHVMVLCPKLSRKQMAERVSVVRGQQAFEVDTDHAETF
jgi:parvulin-like peptidyl-prolyl isomerase